MEEDSKNIFGEYKKHLMSWVILALRCLRFDALKVCLESKILLVGNRFMVRNPLPLLGEAFYEFHVLFNGQASFSLLTN